MKTLTKAALAAVGLFAIASPALADWHHDRGHHRGWHHDRHGWDHRHHRRYR